MIFFIFFLDFLCFFYKMWEILGFSFKSSLFEWTDRPFGRPVTCFKRKQPKLLPPISNAHILPLDPREKKKEKIKSGNIIHDFPPLCPSPPPPPPPPPSSPPVVPGDLSQTRRRPTTSEKERERREKEKHLTLLLATAPPSQYNRRTDPHPLLNFPNVSAHPGIWILFRFFPFSKKRKKPSQEEEVAPR